MAGQIRMTPSDMRQHAGTMRNQRDAVSDVLNKMNSELSILQDQWEGEAARGYQSRWDEIKPSFQNAIELLNEMQENLDILANRFEEADVFK